MEHRISKREDENDWPSLSLIDQPGKEIGAAKNHTTTARKNGYGCETEGHDSQVSDPAFHWQQRNDKVRAEQYSDSPYHERGQAHGSPADDPLERKESYAAGEQGAIEPARARGQHFAISFKQNDSDQYGHAQKLVNHFRP